MSDKMLTHRKSRFVVNPSQSSVKTSVNKVNWSHRLSVHTCPSFYWIVPPPSSRLSLNSFFSRRYNSCSVLTQETAFYHAVNFPKIQVYLPRSGTVSSPVLIISASPHTWSHSSHQSTSSHSVPPSLSISSHQRRLSDSCLASSAALASILIVWLPLALCEVSDCALCSELILLHPMRHILHNSFSS